MIKDSISRKLFNAFNILFMCLMMVVMLFPYLHIFAKALNEGTDSSRGGILIWPRVPTWENFQTILTDPKIIKAAGVSIYTVVVGTILHLFTQFTAAYAFLKRTMRGRSALLMFFMIPMYFGGGIIPAYILYGQVGLLNNYLIYVLPGCFSVYNMVIIRSYLRSIPASLFEAAKLDGASEFAVFAKIVLPLSLPILATIGLWTAVGMWSNWTTALYYVTRRDMWNLQYVLVQILKESDAIREMMLEAQRLGEEVGQLPKMTSESLKCAQVMVTSLPIIAVYPFVQKYFIKGATLGAVKD